MQEPPFFGGLANKGHHFVQENKGQTRIQRFGTSIALYWLVQARFCPKLLGHDTKLR
jgi:hypothetical protein